MKKKFNCIIDFGQTHLKFNLITENSIVTRTLVYKNRLTILRNKTVYYDFLKIKNKIKYHLEKLFKNYNINKISYVCHGSACFFFDKYNKINNGFHFSKKINKSDLFVFKKYKPNFSETYTPDYKNLHNLGKNFFFINQKNTNVKFMPLNACIGFIFSNKNITDPTYISCHSYLWDFKKKKYSSLVNNTLGIKKMPLLKNSGNYIANLSKNFIKSNYRCKIYNGGHDTSAAFYFHSIFFKKNTIFLSTGTTFVFGKILKKLKKIDEKSNFYYLNSLNMKDILLSRRFMGGSLYNKIRQKKNIKNSNSLLANYTFKELKNYLKIFNFNNFNLVIDGPFSQNRNFVLKLKKLNENMNIYTAKNKNSPSLGMSYMCNKKKFDLPINKFYNKY